MLAKRNPPPRFLETRGARFRFAYELYGWKILLACLWGIPTLVFAGWAVSTRGSVSAIPLLNRTQHGFGENDNTIFQAEILYAAAHRYANDHGGCLPDAANWQVALRPYLARAGAAPALHSFTSLEGAGRFVMNRDLSGASLKFVPNASRTLLFWQAVTNETALPSSSYNQASASFGGVACDGTAYYLVPTEKESDPLIWRLAQRSRPPTARGD